MNSSYKFKAHFLMCFFLLFFCFGCKKNINSKYIGLLTSQCVELQKDYNSKLTKIIRLLKKIKDLKTVEAKRKCFIDARLVFKSIEPYLAYSDIGSFKTLNAPNLLKVDEEDVTNITIKKPYGFQVIEEMIFEDDLDFSELEAVLHKTISRLAFILSNHSLSLKKHQVIWLLRDEVVRVSLTGITGFDSPVLEQSLLEAEMVYRTLEYIILSYKSLFTDAELYEQWKSEFLKTRRDLNSDFNTFNRYNFIKQHCHKQLQMLVKTAKDWDVHFPFQMAFLNSMTSLFSDKTFNMDYFADPFLKTDNFNQKSDLGKKLFNDVRLSNNNTMSCATCHQEDKAFTDGLRIFKNQKRNTPTLTYAAIEKAFFYDNRSGSLEGQIVNVVTNVNEFHSSLKDLENFVKRDSFYSRKFEQLYGKVTDDVIRNAIANYVRCLTKFNSKFDNNINDKENSLTSNEINGFNLFMGKAKCATCHFPPVFNGTVPPNFTDTELEAIGVPNLAKTALSDDLGRYDIFKTPERKHFFKTPTIRNIEKTAPYMHNGSYTSLQEIVEFYNTGGGVGMGLKLKLQTLPADSLHLSKKEISDIVAFMKTLSDN